MSNVLFLAGPAGSGKTTLGNALAATWNVPHVDFDEATMSVVTHFHDDHPYLSDAEVLEATRAERYEALRAAVITSIRSHTTVVVSAPLRRETASVAAWQAWIAPITGADVRLVWLEVSAAERLDRMTRRGLVRDQPALATGPVEPSPPVFADRILDAQLPLTDLLRALGSPPGSNFDIS